MRLAQRISRLFESPYAILTEVTRMEAERKQRIFSHAEQLEAAMRDVRNLSEEKQAEHFYRYMQRVSDEDGEYVAAWAGFLRDQRDGIDLPHKILIAGALLMLIYVLIRYL